MDRKSIKEIANKMNWENVNRNPSCPKCGKELYRIYYGRVNQEWFNKHARKGVLGGCICFGDERDAEYVCKKCKVKYSSEEKEIHLVSCPLEASVAIFDYECRAYETLKSKQNYRLLEDTNKICNMICPVMKSDEPCTITTITGKKYTGIITRAYEKSFLIKDNHVSISVDKSINNSGFMNIRIRDIADIKIIDDGNTMTGKVDEY